MITRSRSRSSEGTPAADDSQSSSPSFSQSLNQEEVAPKPKRKQVGKGRGLDRKQDKWVCLVPKSFSSTSSGESAHFNSIVTLKNPSSNCSSRYLLKECTSNSTEHHSEICEILKFSDNPRSWFLGNSIHTDGSLYMCTPIDPLFLALPYFQAAAKCGKFTTLDVILEDHESDVFTIISKCVPKEQWANISEEKSIGGCGTVVYKYSKERTLLWLGKKVAALAAALEEEKVYVGRGSQSSMLVKSAKDSDATKDNFMRFACGMIKDYLNDNLAKEISSIYIGSGSGHLDNSTSKADGKGETDGLEPPAQKRRHEDSKSEPLEDYSSYGVNTAELAKVVPKQTAAQKNLAKINRTGIKPLSSFFKKKQPTTPT